MTLFRARRYGTAEWTTISISDGPEEEADEDGLAPIICGIIGSSLGTSSLHVQQLNDQGAWEDLE